MILDKIIPFPKKKKENATELPLIKKYILQCNYKKTRGGWILQLHEALRKIWFFMGGKWPWIKVFCWTIDQQKIINKKMTMHRGTRKKPFRDESTIRSFTINTIDMTIFRGITFRYFWFNDVVEEYIGVNSVNPCKDLTYTTIAEKITTWRGLVEKKKMGHHYLWDTSLPGTETNTKMGLLLPWF